MPAAPCSYIPRLRAPARGRGAGAGWWRGGARARRPQEWIDRGQWGSQGGRSPTGEGGGRLTTTALVGLGRVGATAGTGSDNVNTPTAARAGASWSRSERDCDRSQAGAESAAQSTLAWRARRSGALVVVAVGVAGRAQPDRRGWRAAYDHRARGVGAPREVGGRGPGGGEGGASHTPTAARAGASWSRSRHGSDRSQTGAVSAAQPTLAWRAP